MQPSRYSLGKIARQLSVARKLQDAAFAHPTDKEKQTLAIKAYELAQSSTRSSWREVDSEAILEAMVGGRVPHKIIKKLARLEAKANYGIDNTLDPDNPPALQERPKRDLPNYYVVLKTGSRHGAHHAAAFALTLKQIRSTAALSRHRQALTREI